MLYCINSRKHQVKVCFFFIEADLPCWTYPRKRIKKFYIIMRVTAVQENYCKQMSTPVTQPRIVFGRGQPVTSSVTDVVLSPTVSSVYFVTVRNVYEAPVKILARWFGRHDLFNLILAALRLRTFFLRHSRHIRIVRRFSASSLNNMCRQIILLRAKKKQKIIIFLNEFHIQCVEWQRSPFA